MISDEEVVDVSFRKLVQDIPSTTYLTHGIHYYPATFIPQVVRYCLDKYTKPFDWVLDPFAGSGSVGVECFITSRNATLVDINPMTDWLVKIKTMIPPKGAEAVLRKLISDSLTYTGRPYTPVKWGNYEYWHPPEVIQFLSKIWGYIHRECNDSLKILLIFAALDVTRFLSYTDDQVPKLFKSKKKVKSLREFLTKENWIQIVTKRYINTAKSYLKSLLNLRETVSEYEPSIEVHAPQDIEYWSPTRDYRLIITSPPYLQAQEYIRSSKIDLFWLDYGHKEVRSFSRREIPYRTSRSRVHTPTLDLIRREVMNSDKSHLIGLFDSYFYFVLTNLLKVAKSLESEGHLCVFVGSATVAGITVPLWKIFCEYFEEEAFTTEAVFKDKIVAKKLFLGRQNPNPDGIQAEHLAVLRRS